MRACVPVPRALLSWRQLARGIVSSEQHLLLGQQHLQSLHQQCHLLFLSDSLCLEVHVAASDVFARHADVTDKCCCYNHGDCSTATNNAVSAHAATLLECKVSC